LQDSQAQGKRQPEALLRAQDHEVAEGGQEDHREADLEVLVWHDDGFCLGTLIFFTFEDSLTWTSYRTH
jgi:hypothetical protein